MDGSVFADFGVRIVTACREYEEESLDYLHMREGLVEDSPLVGGWDSSVTKKDAYESLR